MMRWSQWMKSMKSMVTHEDEEWIKNRWKEVEMIRNRKEQDQRRDPVSQSNAICNCRWTGGTDKKWWFCVFSDKKYQFRYLTWCQKSLFSRQFPISVQGLEKTYFFVLFGRFFETDFCRKFFLFEVWPKYSILLLKVGKKRSFLSHGNFYSRDPNWPKIQRQ
jgi:hypothetical protein